MFIWQQCWWTDQGKLKSLNLTVLRAKQQSGLLQNPIYGTFLALRMIRLVSPRIYFFKSG